MGWDPENTTTTESTNPNATTAIGSDKNNPLQQLSNENGLAARTLSQLSDLSPKAVSQMANACSGVMENYRNGTYNKYLSSVTIQGAEAPPGTAKINGGLDSNVSNDNEESLSFGSVSDETISTNNRLAKAGTKDAPPIQTIPKSDIDIKSPPSPTITNKNTDYIEESMPVAIPVLNDSVAGNQQEKKQSSFTAQPNMSGSDQITLAQNTAKPQVPSSRDEAVVLTEPVGRDSLQMEKLQTEAYVKSGNSDQITLAQNTAKPQVPSSRGEAIALTEPVGRDSLQMDKLQTAAYVKSNTGNSDQITLAQNTVKSQIPYSSDVSSTTKPTAPPATSETIATNQPSASKTIAAADSPTSSTTSPDNSKISSVLANLSDNSQPTPAKAALASNLRGEQPDIVAVTGAPYQPNKEAILSSQATTDLASTTSRTPLDNTSSTGLYSDYQLARLITGPQSQDNATSNAAIVASTGLAAIFQNWQNTGAVALGRDNNVALSQQPLMLSPYFDPSHPLFMPHTYKPDTQISSALSIKEAPATYTASTGFALGPVGQNIKDGGTTANMANAQTIAQALQGLMQQGQGAVKAGDDTGKFTGKAPLGPALPDVITINQPTGKKGEALIGDNAGGGLMPLPGTLTTKDGKGLTVIDEGKLPVGQVVNPTTGLIVTAVAGTTVPTTTITPTTTTGTAIGTTPGTTNTNVKDPDATDIDSLLDSALPEVELFDSKEEAHQSTRPEINYDSIDENDDDDDFIEEQIVDGKRANSAPFTQGKKPKSKLGLSIIENVMVLINDLKNKQLDDKTSQQMLLDLFTDIFSQTKRHMYEVKEEDTLEDIARYLLKDPRLATLLYTINVHAKNIQPVENEQNTDNIYAIKPVAGQKLLLPHRSEILRYKIHVLKDKQALVLYAKGSSMAESNGFTNYVCREGDTLKAIAESHIDLKDANKWGDIALLNGLSARLDKHGEPIAKLKAGQELKIPKPPQNAEYDEDELTVPTKEGAPATRTVVSNKGLAAMGLAGAGKNITDAPATKPLAGASMSVTGTLANLNIEIKDERDFDRILTLMQTRIITQSDLGSQDDALVMSLELKQGNNRLNVAQWDISPLASTLKLYNHQGGCQVIDIGLPTRAARELAENDLKVNADKYCRMFLTGELAA